MTLKLFIAVAGVLMLLSSGVGQAQTPAPADKPAATTDSQSKAKKPKAQRSAKSMECSKQADEKSLHGKARQKFRAKCMKG